MKTYLDIVKKVLNEGKIQATRQGIDAYTLPAAYFEHDMEDGYPLLTTKSVPLRLVASELEFFMKGITDKEWLKDRNNHIWDEWCSPDKVPYAHDEETYKKMAEERELGPIYGWQWRNYGAKYTEYDKPPIGKGVDQLKEIIRLIKEDPQSRRMILLAWNPVDLPRMALPPCHYCVQFNVVDGKLNLMWNQRSVDVALGLPFNIASYALLLHLMAKETGLKEGKLIGFLSSVHIFVNHVEGLNEQLSREPMKLSAIVTSNFTSIFDWKYEDTEVLEYEHHPRIKFEIAI